MAHHTEILNLDSDDDIPEPEQLMEEITFLKNVIHSQKNEIHTLKENNIKQEPGLSPPNTPCKPLTKPRDIPVLELHQLEGLEASACLQIFFELVEQCSNDGSTVVPPADLLLFLLRKR